jgi:hypothetical protein
LAVFHFHGFILQTAQPNDNFWKIAKAWTEADPDHGGVTSPSFWFEQDAGIESYVLEDSAGVVFFFKMVRKKDAVELHIQFPPTPRDPEESKAQSIRIASALTLGLGWIEKVLASRGVSRLFFTSKSQKLIRFCEKRLKFTRDGERLEKPIPPQKLSASPWLSGN